MKLMAAGFALLLLGSAGAEAGLFGGKDKLPKAIDHPMVRPKLREDHKVGKRAGRHPASLMRPTYGADWGKSLNMKRHHPIPEYLKESQ